MHFKQSGVLGNKQTEILFSKYSVYMYLSIIITLAAFLRLYKLDFKSLWLDELYTVVPTHPSNTLAFIINYCKSDQPPLYFVILHYWFKLFGYTSFAARLMSVVIGILGVGAMFFLGNEIKGRQVGIFASFLTGINYFHIYFSQEARFYSLLFLLTALSFIFFIRSIKYKRYRDYALYFIATTALLYTQYFGILIFAIQGVIFLIYVYLFKPGAKFVIICIGLALLIICSFIPWLPILVYDSNITSYWIETPKPYFFMVYYYLYWGKDAVLAVILLVVASTYLRHFFSIMKARANYTFEIFIGIVLGLWIILSYLIPYLRSLISVPILIPRYTLVTLPAIFLIIGMGFNLIRNQKVKILLVVTITLSAIINLFFVRDHYSRIDKAQWREAAHVVISKHQPNIKVYSNLEWWYNFYFYFVKPPIKVIGTFSSNEKSEQQPFIDAIGNEEQFWVLSGEGMNGVNNMQQAYLDSNFRIKEVHSFFAASAILYERNQ